MQFGAESRGCAHPVPVFIYLCFFIYLFLVKDIYLFR